jgi:hypothetical protein
MTPASWQVKHMKREKKVIFLNCILCETCPEENILTYSLDAASAKACVGNWI